MCDVSGSPVPAALPRPQPRFTARTSWREFWEIWSRRFPRPADCGTTPAHWWQFLEVLDLMDDDVLGRAWPLGFTYGASFAQLYDAVESSYATWDIRSTRYMAAPCPRATAELRSSLEQAAKAAEADFRQSILEWRYTPPASPSPTPVAAPASPASPPPTAVAAPAVHVSPVPPPRADSTRPDPALRLPTLQDEVSPKLARDLGPFLTIHSGDDARFRLPELLSAATVALTVGDVLEYATSLQVLRDEWYAEAFLTDLLLLAGQDPVAVSQCELLRVSRTAPTPGLAPPPQPLPPPLHVPPQGTVQGLPNTDGTVNLAALGAFQSYPANEIESTAASSPVLPPRRPEERPPVPSTPPPPVVE